MRKKHLRFNNIQTFRWFSWLFLLGACAPSRLPDKQTPGLPVYAPSPQDMLHERQNSLVPSSSQSSTPSTPLVSSSPILDAGSQNSRAPQPGPAVSADILAPSSSGGMPSQPISAMEAQTSSSAPVLNWWDDIVLSETGESLVGPQARASLKGDLANSRVIRLKLSGHFNLSPDLTTECSRFTKEFGLLQQMFNGSSPKCRVVMDKAILWDVVSVSADTILIQLNTRGLAEFYLTGLHQLALETPSRREEKLILVGKPVTQADLRPAISQVGLVKDEQQKPAYLKIQGAQLMINPALVNIKVDGILCFPAFMQVLSDDSWEIFVPVEDNFDVQQEHTVQYTTPFGFTFAVYEGEQI